MKRIIAGFIIILILTASGASASLSELTVNLNITGGDRVTRNITVENTDSKSLILSFETIVTPDSYGINITYSINSPFTIQANQKLTLIMFINTSLTLMPGTYQITTKFYTEASSPTARKTVHYSWTPPISPINETNETIPPIIPPPENNTIPYNPQIIEGGFNWYIFLIPVVIALVIMLLALLRRKKKIKEVRNENTQNK